MGNRPATLSFRQIVIAPRPAPEAKARTRAQADSIVLELRRGADFATAAKRFSQDPGSQGPGRLAQLVPPRGDGAGVRAGGVRAQAGRGLGSGRVAVRLPHHPGRAGAAGRGAGASHPARSRRSTRSTWTARGHSPTRSGSSCSVARRSIRCSGRLHDPSAEKQAENVPADKLPEAYAKAIGDADSGAVAPVFSLPGAGTREQFVVVQVDRTAPAGRHPLRGREGPDPRPARPAARHPALPRPAAGARPTWRCRLMTRPRLAITLGDPRGIGPEITARALARAVDAEITLVGAEDQIAAIPAARRVGVGTWGLGSGERAETGRGRSGRAGSPATRWRRRSSWRCRARWTRSSPRPRTSTPCTSPAFPIPVTPSGWRTWPATWTWR